MQEENGIKTRNLWAEEEDHILRREIVKQGSATSRLGKPRDWRAVAEKLPGRSNKDCRKRWFKLDSKINKGPWSQEENKRLHEAVARYSTVWTEVAQVVGTRQPDQCAKRWQHFLDPGLNRNEWTPEEDDILVAEVEKRGRNWKQIVDEVLHRRSANDAKNRFTILQRMRQSTNNNPKSISPSLGQHRPAISRPTTATSELSPQPSPQSEVDLLPQFYVTTPESIVGNPSNSQSHRQGEDLDACITTNSELGHDDLHMANMYFHSPDTAGRQLSHTTSSSYLGASGSGSTPDVLGEMDTEPPPSLQSWVDFMMGSGLPTGTDCSTPALCDDDSRIDAARSDEGEMQLDAPPPLPLPPLPTPTPTTTTTTTDPHLPLNDLQPTLEWNWDSILDPDLPPPDQETVKKRTMILQQMQPDQISRVMDFLLSMNTPIDVKIVNPDT
ncbi:uncharacterized protein BDV14DRAFT_203727 [Aspergillus stella-maris]|uniref:uncharacterized protein n=1 Tax=Aspergillus stella-maris TaxID=1810926 RepID=UPI003CCE2001